MYADEELLDAIRDLADELGETPTMNDIDAAQGYPSAVACYERFGSWNAALLEAGLEPSHNKIEHTEDELLNAIRSLAKDLGRTPSSNDMNDAEGTPHTSTYQGRFGSWSQAVEAAGLNPYSPGEPKLPSSMDGTPIDTYERGSVGEAIVATEISFKHEGDHIRLTFPKRMTVTGVYFIAESAIGAVDSTGTFDWLVAITASEQAIDRHVRLSDLLDVLDQSVGEVFK